MHLYYISKTRMQLVKINSKVKLRLFSMIAPKIPMSQQRNDREVASLRGGAQKVKLLMRVKDILHGLVELEQTEIFLRL